MEFRGKYEDRYAMKRKVLLQLEDQITKRLPFPMISHENAQKAWQLAFDGVRRMQFRTIEQIWTYIVTKATFDSFPYFHGMQHKNYSFEVIADRLETMLENYIESSEVLTEKKYSFLESQDVEEETDYVRQEISLSQFLSQRLQKVGISFTDCEKLALELMHFLTDRRFKISKFSRYWRYTRMKIFDILEDFADSLKDLKTEINQSVITDVQADKKEFSLEKSAVRKVEQTHESFTALKFQLTTVLDNFFCHLTECYELEDDAPYFYHTMKTTRKTQRGEMVVIDGKSSKDDSETKPTPDVELKVVESSTDDQPIAPKPPSDEKLEVGSTSDCIPEAQPPSIDDIFNQAKQSPTSDSITDAQPPSIDDIFQKAKEVSGFQGIYQVDGENGKPFIVVDTYNDKDHSVENFLKTEYRDWWGKDLFVVVEQDHAIRHLVHSGSGIYHKSEGSIACLASDGLNLEKMYAITAQHNFKCQPGYHHETDIEVKYGQENDMKILGNNATGVYGTFDGSFVDIAAVELSKKCLDTLDKQEFRDLAECYNGNQADLKEVRVAKAGVTGTTKGVIINTNYHLRITRDNEKRVFMNLIMIKSAQEGDFASFGDSGSLVYRENSGQPIGIVTLGDKRKILNQHNETEEIYVVMAFKLKNGIDALATYCDLNVKACQQYENVIPVIASPNTDQCDYDGQRNPEETNESDENDSQASFVSASPNTDQCDYDGQRNPKEINESDGNDLQASLSVSKKMESCEITDTSDKENSSSISGAMQWRDVNENGVKEIHTPCINGMTINKKKHFVLRKKPKNTRDDSEMKEPSQEMHLIYDQNQFRRKRSKTI